MNRNKDAFGKEMWAFFKGAKPPEIIERDDGYIDAGFDYISKYFSDFKNWFPIEKKLIPFVKGRALDVGAGAGRVELYLQKKGIKTTAIDNSPLAIKVCRLRGVKDARAIPIANIGKFAPKTFSTIIMFGHNLGLLGSYKRAKILLRKMHRITTGDALILGTSRDPYRTNSPVHLKYHRLNLKRGRMAGQLRIRVRFADCIGEWFDYLFVSISELKQILHGTGWRLKKVIRSDADYAVVLEKV